MTKHGVLCSFLIISLWALTACGQQLIPNSSSHSSASNTSNNTQNTAENSNNQSFETSPIVAPPNYDDRPLEPGQSPSAQRLPNGLPALKPLKGVNVDKLFAENISDSNRRFDRLENAVVDMRREFEAVKPAIVRLVAVEEDIQQMVEQLEAIAAAPPAPTRITREPLTQQDLQTNLQAPQSSQTSNPEQGHAKMNGVGKPQVMEPKPSPAKPMAITPSAKVSATDTDSGAPMVKNLRTGVHSDKLRLVLDMSRKTPYSVDLDSSENILIIELPEASWAGARSKTFNAKEPLLASYNVESINNGKGSRIIIPLKSSSVILKQDILPPGVTPNYRLYIDLERY